ncbi:MAG: hypothetical protein ACE5OZ_20545 [Candidatus Heimdallarchaeota archaeon]
MASSRYDMTGTSYFTLKYPSKKQIELWNLRREQLASDKPLQGKEIAKQQEISPASVSKALTNADDRIRLLLENAARMNTIHLELLSPALGYARGQSLVFKVKAYITYSPVNGVKVWYAHQGDCAGCEEFGMCRQAIYQEFKERNLSIPNPPLRPTDLIETLIEQLEGLVK